MSKFKYKRGSDETVQKRAQGTGGDWDGYTNAEYPVFRPKEGESNLRIMPPTWDYDEWGDNWAIEVWLHRDIGPDNNI